MLFTMHFFLQDFRQSRQHPVGNPPFFAHAPFSVVSLSTPALLIANFQIIFSPKNPPLSGTSDSFQ